MLYYFYKETGETMKKFWVILSALLLMSPTILKAEAIANVDQFNNLVIFIRFADERRYDAPYEIDYYNNLFNGEGPSLRDYYLEVSYDQLTIDSLFAEGGEDIVFYTDNEDRSYYEPYDEIENPNGYTEYNQYKREHALLSSSIEYAESEGWFDASLDYDKNKDGEIDSITFLISGEDAGWNSLLWPHKYNMVYDSATLFGLEVNTYTFGLLGNSTDYSLGADLGTIAHETFHLLSAPDLYHYYNYTTLSPIGPWGIMDEVDTVPSHMLGYMKLDYGGWIETVEELDVSGTYTLYPLQDSPDNMYKIELPFDNEYIYLEYRDNEGIYESTLPFSGLIVYRVNEDYYGNESADYVDELDDEIFVFRPLVEDVVEPITFEDILLSDGYVYEAALSQTNYMSEANVSDDFMLFSSSGERLDFTITNVVEYDEYIEFDLSFEPRIVLDLNVDVDTESFYLLDLPGTLYTAKVNGLKDNQVAYYTTDGSRPTIDTSIYEGMPIIITPENNTVRVGIYENDILISEYEETYHFVDHIESDHDGYGDNTLVSYVANFIDITNVIIQFSSDSEIEEGYDFITVNGYTYSGSQLASLTLPSTNDGFVFVFESDELSSSFYGFNAIVDVIDPFNVTLNGEEEVDVSINSNYEDLGMIFPEIFTHEYKYEVESDVDVTQLGSYTVTYTLYTKDKIFLQELVRTVNVVDETPPTVSLNIGLDTIRYGDEWEDAGIEATDNSNEELVITVEGEVGTNPGTYSILYHVADQSGNTTTARRIVNVLEPPIDYNIVCGTMKQTLGYGEEANLANCRINGLVMNKTTLYKPGSVGLFEVNYSITIDGFKITHRLYFYVLNNISREVMFDEERKRYYEI